VERALNHQWLQAAINGYKNVLVWGSSAVKIILTIT